MIATIETTEQYLRWSIDGMRKLCEMQGTKPPEKGYEQFVLDNGKAYDRKMPFAQVQQEFGGGTPRNCYGDAYQLAMDNDDLTYVEGYAMNTGLAVQHAWVVDSEGTVIDITWAAGWEQYGDKDEDPDSRRSYYGFEVPTETLEQWVDLTGHYGVLGNDWMIASLVIERGLGIVDDPSSCDELIDLCNAMAESDDEEEA